MQRGEVLEPMEGLVADVIARHAEYHALLSGGPEVLGQDFTVAGKRNPFLHMGLHIALMEQIQTDRPKGISDIYRQLLTRSRQDAHTVEHDMMECLAEVLWTAQQNGHMPDDEVYLLSLRRL
jgi:hypothetical protein